jgi:hypothetical protein
MKKLLIAVFVVAVLSFGVTGFVFAAQQTYGAAGCGLGSMLFGNEQSEVQIFAATTNGTSANQLFGITSGTLNCEKQPKSFANRRANEFVAANMDRLAKDIAAGNGEALDTLAELIGITAEQRSVIYAKLQSNFSDIFTSEQVVAADVIDSIVTIVNG